MTFAQRANEVVPRGFRFTASDDDGGQLDCHAVAELL